MAHDAGLIPLTPALNVAVRDGGGFDALSVEPWLALPRHAAVRAGRFIEITYSLSFWDEPVRPVFRFLRGSDVLEEHIGAGPVAGRASWIGRVPAGTTAIWVSPTCRAGPFRFAIESIRNRRLASLLTRALRQAPRQTRSAILTRLIGWGPEAESNFRWALGFTPLGRYPAWARQRSRPIDLAGLDRPRFDWETGPTFKVVLSGQNRLGQTLASLSAQVYPRRTVRFVPAQPRDGQTSISLDDRFDDVAAEQTFVVALRAGETLRPETLAVVAEAAHRDPTAVLFYGDVEDLTGSSIRPQPGWSPTLFAAREDVGRAVFVAMSLWAEFDADEKARFVATRALPPARIAALAPGAVRAIPRVLLAVDADEPANDRPTVPAAVTPRGDVRATIVIPTRDRADLLARCVESIRAHPCITASDIVIVDNGSAEPAAVALLRDLAAAAHTTVLSRPGPFNYAALCNDAARLSAADVLVFLNNDTAVRSDGWLDRLVAHACLPEVGAVGAKLLLPDGRVQHIGVVLGLGGLAGHFGASQAADAPGWAGRHGAVHDVAAVTGACLAVERSKFEAVGGFDALHLPIELNDIDLCLQLAARGWRARVDPAVELLHEESASRGGATFRRLRLYADQRAVFAERWRSVIRDDPYFHPGLSLYNLGLALG